MRKLIILLIPIIFFIQSTYATDSCEKIVLQEAEFVGEIIISANVRDYPCINKSTIVKGSSVWERYNVIAKVDGWYKIKLDNGEVVWIRDQAIKKVWELPEALKEVTVQEEIKIVVKEYELTVDDFVVINIIDERIKSIIDDRWVEYKEIFISRLENLLVSKLRSERYVKVVEQIIEDVRNME